MIINKISSKPIEQFPNRHILLTITGGIAAYKSCYLIRELILSGYQVQALMTKSATRFITPLTLATLSGNDVLTDLFPDTLPSNPIHLTTVKWGDILVVAPATANYIGKLTCGLADDLVSAVALAYDGPILIAPAMNPKMWQNDAVQDNIRTLKNRGVHFIGPVSGDMGGVNEDAGMGRMVEPSLIFNRIEELSADQPLKGYTVLVTSGPTREPLDPVRYISNHSSGRMGDAIARQAYIMGAEVKLVRGKGAIGDTPFGVDLIEVETAQDMYESVKKYFDKCDIAVMAAAVADWSVENPAAFKLKKKDGLPSLNFIQTKDILVWACQQRKKQIVIGFALETRNHLKEAKLKLVQKGADMIVLNDPTREDSKFGGDTTKLTLLTRGDKVAELPVLTKRDAAGHLLDAVRLLLPIK
ncbi:MAG: bifunctional phosphopantothenoylcysteine decarboxylase/phosphopantothenate--cysteine ligase CoaBC [Candidatus Hatepunaea meridiana]|nr:bifunctional phosphopantothenoylcysteine decarboxylase/phosphopantothenate--cysteine ligase CoaBC [Candidatus Hatepunaea meridiana]